MNEKHLRKMCGVPVELCTSVRAYYNNMGSKLNESDREDGTEK